jgi:citrate lyase beta subunit
VHCAFLLRAVRINPVGSGLEADDIKHVLSGQVLPQGIVLPKVERARFLEIVVMLALSGGACRSRQMAEQIDCRAHTAAW